MKRLSNERIEALSLVIVDRIERERDATVRDRGSTVRAVANRLRQAFQTEGELDRSVRARISSLNRSVPEGSREWDLLYRQYLDELSRRR